MPLDCSEIAIPHRKPPSLPLDPKKRNSTEFGPDKKLYLFVIRFQCTWGSTGGFLHESSLSFPSQPSLHLPPRIRHPGSGTSNLRVTLDLSLGLFPRLFPNLKPHLSQRIAPLPTSTSTLTVLRFPTTYSPATLVSGQPWVATPLPSMARGRRCCSSGLLSSEYLCPMSLTPLSPRLIHTSPSNPFPHPFSICRYAPRPLTFP